MKQTITRFDSGPSGTHRAASHCCGRLLDGPHAGPAPQAGLGHRQRWFLRTQPPGWLARSGSPLQVRTGLLGLSRKGLGALWAALAFATAASGLAQGLVNVANRNGFVQAPIFDMDGTPLRGPDYVAQLYAGPVAGSLTPQAEPIPFRTGPESGWGYLFGGPIVLDFVEQGETFAAQLRVWNIIVAPTFEEARAAGGLWGMSDVIYPQAAPHPVTGQWSGPEGYLVGLQSFSLIPEPRMSALLLLGAGWLGWMNRRRRTRARPPSPRVFGPGRVWPQPNSGKGRR